jgi:hypothetical protein
MNVGARPPRNCADDIASEFLIVNDEDPDSAQPWQLGSRRRSDRWSVSFQSAGAIRRGFDEGQLHGERRAAPRSITCRANATAMQFHE